MRLKSFMHTTILTLIFLLVAQHLSSQNNVPVDKRVTEAFGKEYTVMLQKNNPDLLNYYQFYLNNAWQVVNLPPDKAKYIKPLELLPGKKEGPEFNLLLYNVVRHFDRPTYYMHKGKIVRILSEQDLMQQYNEKVRNLTK
jgi:hypothetical protein